MGTGGITGPESTMTRWHPVAELMAAVEQYPCEDGTGGEGCVQLSQEARNGGYWFFLSDGLMPPPVFGYANGPEPATAVITRLATEAPT
jgi:hypothetical protein